VPVRGETSAGATCEILSEFECGIVLAGAEVKSLRDGKAVITDSFARVDDGELWLHRLHIAPWTYAHGVGATDPDRPRKLLMHKTDIERIGQRLALERLNLIPLKIYFVGGRAKVELGLGRSRKAADKRQVLAERDSQREIERAMRTRRDT
jgi:SsrA-binding protein